jgi:SAM-dependent methyltransferase
MEEHEMSEPKIVQLSTDAAVVYEQDFVPALFGQWAPRLADAVDLRPRDRVLDVGCGTGVVAREAALRVGSGGRVVGLDLNESMLAVAKRMRPEIEWRQGDVIQLPFEDESFDAVVSQFMLMFIADRVTAIKEMWRVLAPGGRLAVAAWMAFERSAGDVALAKIARRLIGDDAAEAFRAPYVLGDDSEFLALFHSAGILDAKLETREGWFSFSSIDEMVRVWVKGWVLADLDDETYAALLKEARKDLMRFCNGDGEIRLPMDAHIVTARKP